ncbi:uncharacterized protein ACOB8E_014857 [Sarcophilus harrisii]
MVPLLLPASCRRSGRSLVLPAFSRAPPPGGWSDPESPPPAGRLPPPPPPPRPAVRRSCWPEGSRWEAHVSRAVPGAPPRRCSRGPSWGAPRALPRRALPGAASGGLREGPKSRYCEGKEWGWGGGGPERRRAGANVAESIRPTPRPASPVSKLRCGQVVFENLVHRALGGGASENPESGGCGGRGRGTGPLFHLLLQCAPRARASQKEKGTTHSRRSISQETGKRERTGGAQVLQAPARSLLRRRRRRGRGREGKARWKSKQFLRKQSWGRGKAPALKLCPFLLSASQRQERAGRTDTKHSGKGGPAVSRSLQRHAAAYDFPDLFKAALFVVSRNQKLSGYSSVGE